MAASGREVNAIDTRDAKLGALSGIVLGASLIAVFALTPALIGPGDRGEAGLRANVAGIVNVLILIVAVVYVLSLRRTLASNNEVLATAASILFVLAFFLLAITQYFTSQNLGLASSGQLFTSSVTGIAASLVLYGVMMLRSGIYPVWSGYLGISAGIVFEVGMLILARIYLSDIFISIGFEIVDLLTLVVIWGSFIIWVFVSSILLWTSAGRSSVS